MLMKSKTVRFILQLQ